MTKIVRNVESISLTPSAVTIGNFDGVHLGHQALLDRLKVVADEKKLETVVLTFEPAPKEFFSPDSAPARLTNFYEKMRLLTQAGLNKIVCMPFNLSTANITAADFYQSVLVDSLCAKHIIVGDDLHFGKGREGNFSVLQKLSAPTGVVVEALESVLVNDTRVSSTLIREQLALGLFKQAATLLGRPYNITGRIIHGKKLGRTLGFPTINIPLKRNKVALSGIFAVKVIGLGDNTYFGAANLGTRPTVSGLEQLLEVYLLDFDQEVYGKKVSVEFLRKIRDEEKFDSLETMKAVIAKDVEKVRAVLDRRK